MSGGGGQSSNTKTQLPKWLAPYAQSFMSSYGQQVFGPEFTPGASGQTPVAMPADLTQQVAPFDPTQIAAMENISGMTGAEQGLANIGGAQSAATLSGAYLNPATNPYLAATYQAAATPVVQNYQQAVQPGIMAAAQRSGQFGSSAMNELLGTSEYNLGKTLGELGTSIYGQNYQQERANQLGTLAQLPSTLAASYYPQQALMGVGAQRQQLSQSELDTAYQNALNRTEYPYNVLSGLGGALGQAAGGAGTSSTKMSGGGGLFGK